MAGLTLGGTSQQIIGVTRRLVEISDTVGGSWRRAPFLDCEQASESVLPSMQEAALSYHYGTILREGAAQFQRQRPLSLMGRFVRIRTRYGGGTWVTRWCGVIPRESVEVMGKNPSLSGRQVLAALGIEYLLAREGVATSWWLSGGIALQVSAPVQFNQPGAGGAIVGNRSTLEYEGANGTAHIFSQANGALWSAADIIRYLLAWHLPPNCPTVELTGQLETLEAMEPIVSLSGQTILGIITGLVDRRRGLNARLVWDGGETAQLRIATETTVPLRAGDVTLPANPSVVDLDLASGELRRNATVSIDEESRVSEIIVRGQAMRSTFSLSPREDSLEAAWETTAEAAYKSPGVLIAGFTAASTQTQAAVADTVRTTDPAVARVYKAFRLPVDFAWAFPERVLLDTYTSLTTGVAEPAQWPTAVPAFQVLPAFTRDGLLDSETGQPAPERLVRFSRATSILRGWDYITDPPSYVGGERDRDEVEPPFVWMLGVKALDAGVLQQYYDFTKGGDAGFPVGNVSVADDELAVRLDVAPIAHAIALADFVIGSGADASATNPSVNWREMQITVAVEGEPVEMRQAIPGGAGGKRLVIELDNAGLWWIAPGTVVGVGSDGILQRVWQTNGIFTRDDRAWMRSILAMALGWYGKRRAGVQASLLGIGGAPSPQTIIRRVDAAIGRGIEANSLVTRRVFNFATNQTSFSADYAELDAANTATPLRAPALGSGGGSMGGGGAARQNQRLDGVPVRFSAGGGGAGTAGGGGDDPTPVVNTALLDVNSE